MDRRIVVRLGVSCNNCCKFCIFGHERENFMCRTEQQVKSILNRNRAFKRVVFTGGEPCLRADLVNLVTYAKSVGFTDIQIQSNGRMFMYKGFCKELIDVGVNEFALAIHGHNANIHDFLTSAEGSFVQTIKGLINLKDLKQYVITNTVITKTNYTYIPQIAQLLIKLDIAHFQFSFVHIIGRAWTNKDWIVPRKSAIMPYLTKGLQIGLQAGKRVTTEALPYCIMQDYKDCIVERLIPPSKVYELDKVINDLRTYRILKKKAKRKKCFTCSYYQMCEGPWKEYPRLFGWDEFIPIKKT